MRRSEVLRRSAKIGAMMRFMGWVIASRHEAMRALVLHPSDGAVVPEDGTMDEGLARGKGFPTEPMSLGSPSPKRLPAPTSMMPKPESR
jgi:hypothetical protein